MISFESVTQTVEKISAMTIEQTQTLAMQMSEEQPYVLVYLLTACENEAFTNDESELFFFVGSVLWQVMRQNPNGKRQISEKNILNATKSRPARVRGLKHLCVLCGLFFLRRAPRGLK